MNVQQTKDIRAIVLEYKSISTMQPKKILAIVCVPVLQKDIAYGGGVLLTFQGLKKIFEQEGHSFTILSCWNGLDYATSHLYPGFRDFPPTKRNLRKMEAAIRSHDIILMSDNSTGLDVILLCGKHKKPLVFLHLTAIGKVIAGAVPNWSFIMCPAIKMYGKICSKMCSKVLTVSKWIQQTRLKQGWKIDGVVNQNFKCGIFLKTDRKKEIKNLRTNILKECPHKTKIIMYAGRFSKEKRIDKLVPAKPNDCILLIIGDGPHAKDVLKLHDIKNGVIVKRGMVTQDILRKYFKASDAVVSASRMETFGMTVLEAYFSGTMSIVENFGGFIEQINELNCGKLVSFDDFEATKRIIEDSINTKETVKFNKYKGQHLVLTEAILSTKNPVECDKSFGFYLLLCLYHLVMFVFDLFVWKITPVRD